MEEKERKYVPELVPRLRENYLQLPNVIRDCSGIKIMGRRIKSLLFTTDVAIIRFSNADAIIAVYPFTPVPPVTQAILTAADLPVLCGVGGGTTQGVHSVKAAISVEYQGALAVVLNTRAGVETIKNVKEAVDIPIVTTVASINTQYEKKLQAGADILNVSAGPDTAKVVAKIREKYPRIAIIATGGPTDETIRAVIEAGANAITYTPPTTAELFSSIMQKYRKEELGE